MPVIEEYLNYLNTNEMSMGGFAIDSFPTSGKPFKDRPHIKYDGLLDKHLHSKEVEHRKNQKKVTTHK